MQCERRMVKEVKLQGFLERLEPQAVFSFLFGDDQFFKRYHKDHNEDSYADVSEWTAEGRRTVKFSAVLSAPKVIKKVIGVDILKVTELQTYFTIGETFTITSCPTVEHPQGFSATMEMVLSPTEKRDGCNISATVILECQAAVWGVQGTIESFMERKAKKFFWGWLRVARLYCMEQVALAAGLPYAEKEDEELSEAASLDDEFFDFSEQDERALTLTGESRTLGVIYSREGEAGLQNWIMQSVMGQLNGLHITCNASRSHIEELNRRLQKIEGDVLLVQRQLQGKAVYSFPPAECMVWRFVVACVVTGVLFGAGHMYKRSKRSN